MVINIDESAYKFITVLLSNFYTRQRRRHIKKLIKCVAKIDEWAFSPLNFEKSFWFFGFWCNRVLWIWIWFENLEKVVRKKSYVSFSNFFVKNGDFSKWHNFFSWKLFRNFFFALYSTDRVLQVHHKTIWE